MSTITHNGKELQVVTLNRTETHGVICAALFMDYNSVFNGRNNEIIQELTRGRVDNAVHLAIIALANHKIRAEYQDVGELEPPMFDDKGDIVRIDEVTGPDEDDDADDTGYKHDDTFGGTVIADPRSEADFWDGDDTDKITY